MRKTWSRERIIEKIYWAGDHLGKTGTNQQQYCQLKSVLQKMDEAEVFEILFFVLTNTEKGMPRFVEQELAGHLLLSLQPACPLDLSTAVRELLKYYNHSVKQIPWYFARRYGKENILEMLTCLQAEPLTQRQQESLETWEWWLQGKQDLD